MSVQDIYTSGASTGWNLVDATRLLQDQVLETDVVIIGTGAGGGTTAEILASSGLSVIMVEEGKLHSSKDFKMDELDAYPKLYQEGMSRATADGGISIMQGRTVGGSTTVNWTSSFRTPEATLNHWTKLGLKGFTVESMRPWFENREQRLGIEPWAVPPNPNNQVLKTGCETLGWSWHVIPRNVRGCWNIGYCGMGCPTNAKQSMLVTTVPGALSKGASLYYNLRANRLNFQGTSTRNLQCQAIDPVTQELLPRNIEIRARHYVISASAIGSPAVLLRSETPDPYKRIGKRTFLHPVNASLAIMPDKIEPFKGAPQSIYSDEFNWRDGVTGEAGFKMEVPPMFPALSAGIIGEYGEQLAQTMSQLPHINAVLSLIRDGFHEDSYGGEVRLRNDGTPELDYPVTDYLWRALKEAYLRMAELQFAAGAKKVKFLHNQSPYFSRYSDAKQWMENKELKILQSRLFTAHQMGGCSMGEDPSESVVNSDGRHHHIDNLSVIDASTFPTSIGANPQLSIYAMAARQATQLAQNLNSA
ncbi:GMC family oxidoreductase [Hahella sp. CCB-MM4]|uniref:GMC family oxidoreductase n=1 Tax=Hahella sp. (strain CCB-MM4) TaxID=1926491 RepID=UPI000B9ADA18|nr:GMC family oxidoreductase [Hahella sp. CCB-MM4]OZG74954.1 GMC family oxidoreductase [Hahella sp. CCB-MM4]